MFQEFIAHMWALPIGCSGITNMLVVGHGPGHVKKYLLNTSQYIRCTGSATNRAQCNSHETLATQFSVWDSNKDENQEIQTVA